MSSHDREAGSQVTRQPRFLGQTVVVIGGSAGIGLETARHARAEGADVVLTARNRERLEQAGLPAVLKLYAGENVGKLIIVVAPSHPTT